jgi:hypothetical protein
MVMHIVILEILSHKTVIFEINSFENINLNK